MSSFVMQSRLDTVLDVPVSLPQTELPRGSSIVVTSVKLDLGQKLSIGWFSLQLIRVTSGSPDRANTSLGIVYAGIFAGGFDPIRIPSGTPINVISLNGPFTKLLNPFIRREFSGPDVVELVAVNNTSNIDMEIVINGTAKIYLNG